MINYLVISDIHLGHKKNPIYVIRNNLLIFIKSIIDNTKLDILFIAGDTFDRLLELNTIEAQESLLFISDLIHLLARNKIKLRVLEGTPSHDWKCSEYFLHVKNILGNKLDIDLKYVKHLSVEIIEELDLSILYIPDEWHPDTNETFKQAKQAIQEANLTQVDIAIMHGCFNYQLPIAAKKIPRHNEYDYLSIVKYFIHIGHVHVFSIYERILAQGSFDRLAHSEESPKGGVLVSIENNEAKHLFIENKLATIFKTIDIKSNDIDKNLNKIDKVVRSLPEKSHIRIRANKDNPILNSFLEIKNKYPLVNLTKITTEEESIQLSSKLIDDVETDVVFTPITLDKDNILDLVMEGIINKYSLDENKTKQLKSQLSEVI